MFTLWNIINLPVVVFSSLVLLSPAAVSQTFVVSGTVRDKVSNEALVAANIRIDGTTRGTISNADGVYRLSLTPGPYTLIVSFVSYRPDTIRVALSADVVENVFLEPIAVRLAEIVVTDEDPAVRIMRKVIENKGGWKERLNSYQFDAFTRQVMRRDTAIASITESYTTGYWQRGDTLREIIKQKRQTENIPMGQNFAAVGGIVNFYDDDIRFAGFNFVGPTSPEAFDYYEFTLEETRNREGVELFTIRMTPKTKLTPLFKGIISIVGDSYSVVGIEVKPNEAFRIPFISELNITYAQQFAKYDQLFWMPVDIRLNGEAKIGIAGFSFPPIGFNQISSLYEYRINAGIPDTLRYKPRRIAGPGSEKFDSSFWVQKEVLPLTREEHRAYVTLDSTQTLQKQFQPSGPLSFLNDASDGILKYLSLRFNRVEGLFLGGDLELDSLKTFMRVSTGAGYAFSDKRFKLKGELEVFLDTDRSYSIGIRAYKDLAHVPDEGFYETFFITASSLLSKIDQRDYYYTKGVQIILKGRPWSQFRFEATYGSEEHTSAMRRTAFSFFARSRPYRENPPITGGMLRSLSLSARYGDSPVPLGLISTNYVNVEFERSQSTLLKSDFTFSRMSLVSEFFIPTFLRRNLFPPTLIGRVAAGWSAGLLPPQRIFTLEARSNGFAPFGVLKGASLREFSGDRYVSISLEQNFRSVPFLALDIPFLYENSVELILHGSAARTWNSSGVLPYTFSSNGWYSEIGIGISRILGILRLDVTRRLTGSDSWFVTFGTARIF